INRGQKMIYYRLVSTDINGHTSNSKIISLKLNATNWNVQLVTNPVLDRPELFFSGKEGNTKISIKDLNGKTIYDQVIRRTEGKYTKPVNLKREAYILFVADKTHKKSIKIIKD